MNGSGVRTVSILLALSGVFASCSSNAPAETATPAGISEGAPEAEPAKAGASARSDGAGAPNQDDQKREAADQSGQASEPEGPEHCPAEMVYVEGKYCTATSNEREPNESGSTPGAGHLDLKAVEHECLREWYAPQNDKRVCEEFAPKGTCTGKFVEKRFCIDRYAWPNVKGQRPEVMNNFYQAQVKCAAAGKRLCTESEWTFSCEGPEMKPFPYGYVRDANKCHGDEEWDKPDMNKVRKRDQEELKRLYHAERSGQPECVSDFGVYDLPANNDEIVATETFDAGWRSKYESVATGGPWYKGVRNQCRPKIYSHDEGWYHYYLGFRCCAEPDGAETDPVTAKQRLQKRDMRYVERLAGVSVAEQREILETKKTDPTCGCKDSDWRCKTRCGTLHGAPGTGPDAWNPPLGDQAGNGMPSPKGQPSRNGQPAKGPAKGESPAKSDPAAAKGK